MRRKFFYAMLAVGVMASCSKDSYVDSQDPEGNGPTVVDPDGPQPIRISASSTAAKVEVSNRSVGSIGADGANISNEWSGQHLRIFAFPKRIVDNITTKITLDHVEAPLFNKEATAASGKAIQISWVEPGDVYFPRSGAYDFFGYYADDAVATDVAPLHEVLATKGLTPMVDDSTYNVPFTINGAQDLMIAKAALSEEDKTTLGADANKAYSSFTARKTIQPSMKFEHLLTRLTFSLKGAGADKPEEVYIRTISVKSKATGKLVFVYNNPANKGIQWSADEPISLLLQEKSADGSMQQLDKAHNETEFNLYEKEDDAYKYLLKTSLPLDTPLTEILGKYNATVPVGDAKLPVIGESLLLNPADEYVVTVEVMQYYNGSGNMILPPASENDYFKKNVDQRYFIYEIPIKATDVKKEGTDAGITTFAPSSSYNISVVVYGLTDIRITAELGEWIDGGGIEVDPGDKFE